MILKSNFIENTHETMRAAKHKLKMLHFYKT
jgi:hypothetical protein